MNSGENKDLRSEIDALTEIVRKYDTDENAATKALVSRITQLRFTCERKCGKPSGIQLLRSAAGVTNRDVAEQASDLLRFLRERGAIQSTKCGRELQGPRQQGQATEQLDRQERIVVVFDMRSSSRMIEDLNQREIGPYRDLVTTIEKWLQERCLGLHAEVYKFLGDGWILLFPMETCGDDLKSFLESLYSHYLDSLRYTVENRLECRPEVQGIVVGIDHGTLVRFQMTSGKEYVGRAVNVACRLQGKAKEYAAEEGCTILVSNPTYGRVLATSLPDAELKTADLSNIRDGQAFQCRLHRLTSASSQVVQGFGQSGVPVPADPNELPTGVEGKWKNTWRFNGKEWWENIEFLPDKRAFVNGQHKFNIQDLQVDETGNKVKFTKIAVDEPKTLIDDLVIVDKDTLAGIETDPAKPGLVIGIRYVRMS